ncbi:hypothetical protein GCM10011402_36370 [Paracoccus acridae]|uniref:Uncharacterized protein n=1 Tax=Paracoccus acridae TaxID=1795310 RepID=A0ABQ1VMK9_9RHOB|nr:hypothetical protein [Paracoccus acridae]GGF80482.1 hypothetical protein GCM10011402_36370 [Paracoccus acridae]
MSYRITTYSALQANLSAANTAVRLCRANIGRLPLSDQERDATIDRIRKQIGELETLILELEPPGGKQAAPFIRTRVRKAPPRRRTSTLSDNRT